MWQQPVRRFYQIILRSEENFNRGKLAQDELQLTDVPVDPQRRRTRRHDAQVEQDVAADKMDDNVLACGEGWQFTRFLAFSQPAIPHCSIATMTP